MATHSFEFILGIICFASGVMSLVVCWFLKTRRSEAMRQADKELAEDGFPGVTVLGTFLFGSAMALFIGAVLITVSIIAYAGL